MDSNKFDINKLPKEHIFQVPDGYFEELPMRIQAKTSAKAVHTPLVTWSVQRTWAFAAACSAIVILAYFTLMPRQDSLGEESLAGVKNEEIELYLLHQNIHQTDVVDNDEVSTVLNDTGELEMIENLKISNQDILQSVDVEYLKDDI